MSRHSIHDVFGAALPLALAQSFCAFDAFPRFAYPPHAKKLTQSHRENRTARTGASLGRERAASGVCAPISSRDVAEELACSNCAVTIREDAGLPAGATGQTSSANCIFGRGPARGRGRLRRERREQRRRPAHSQSEQPESSQGLPPCDDPVGVVLGNLLGQVPLKLCHRFPRIVGRVEENTGGAQLADCLCQRVADANDSALDHERAHGETRITLTSNRSQHNNR